MGGAPVSGAPPRPVLSLRRRTQSASALRERFGGGLGIFRRGGTEFDLCDSCEIGEAPPRKAVHEAGFGGACDEGAAASGFCHVAAALPVAGHDTLARWLRKRRPWKSTDGGFYRSDEWGVSGGAELPEEGPGDAPAPIWRCWAERCAARLFGEPLVLHEPIALHRLLPGHGVGIHTDQPLPGEETHRIVITFCEPRAPAAGGHFVLLDGDRPQDAFALIPLRTNAAVAFRLGKASYHAVTSVRAGARYSVVMSFRPAVEERRETCG